MSTPFEREPTRGSPRPECGLEHAIDVLRDEVEPRAEWRDALLQELRTHPAPDRHSQLRHAAGSRRWQISPLQAIAAALTFMVLGGAGATVMQSRLSSSAPAADVAAQPSVATESQPPAIGVRFAVLAEGAARVSLVGDFNGWNPDATPLRLADDGRTWVAMFPLREGRHTYAFVIDGEVVADPAAPRAGDDDFGTPSSLMLVSSAR